MTDLSGDGTRVLLIATATHHGSTLPSVPSVARTFGDLRIVLLERCGVRPDRLRGLLDPPDAQTMALAVTEEAQRADTVLLVYFIGHGVLGPGGDVYLAASGTDRLVPGMAEHQALSFSALREAVTASRASSVVVVLDCCFSGRASFGGGASVPAFGMEPAYGMYLIGSAEQLALAPPDAVHTAFTGALIELLTHGDPRSPHLLTLDAVYDALFQAMRDNQQPLPRRQSGDRSGSLVIAPNPAAPAQPQSPDEPQHPGRCPYPGLAPFEIDDADAFFGREQMTGRLLTAVADKPAPLVLVGPSGSGKSSLLNAGLRARLRADGLPGMPGSAGWPCVRLTPGVSPLRRLAAQLNAVTPDAGDRLREDPAHAVELVDTMLADRPGERLIVLVDQLEELFVLCPDPAERTAFLQALAAITEAVDDKPPRGLVVLALRADFYGRAAEHPELLIALRDRQLLVEPMTPVELRAAIEQPAAATGLVLDDGLADVILHELGATTGGSPATGALPLLSHALWATWRERAGSRLTVAGYRATGGISQAIASTAEQVYAALDDAGQTAARRMLPRLVRVGEDNVDTARPVERSTLLHGLSDTRAAQHAIDRFTEARLLTLDRDTIRISHEALLHAWPRLRDWLNADRDWLRARQQLTDDAEAWVRSDRDPSLLYRGNRLAAVRERATQAPIAAGDLEPRLTEFMDTSWHHERRGIRRRRGVITTLAILLIVAGIATTIAFSMAAVARRNAAEADRQHVLALSRQLATQAETLTTSDPLLAQQLAAAAWHISPIPEARRSMLNALATGARGTLPTPSGNNSEPVFSHDGHTLAAVNDNSVLLWDMRTRHPGDVLDTGPVSRIAFGPDDTTLVAVEEPAPGGEVSPVVQIWNLDSPSPTRERFVAGQHPFYLVELSADGRVLVTAGEDGTVWLWDVQTRTPIGDPFLVLQGVGDSLIEVGLSGDNAVLATADDEDGTVRLWNVRTQSSIGSVASHTQPVDEIVFSLDGTTLATRSQDGTVRLWNAGTFAPIGTPLPGLRQIFALSPDGNTVAASNESGDKVQLWDIWLSKPVGVPLAGDMISTNALTFSPSGTILVIITAFGPISLWDMRSRRPSGAPFIGHTEAVNDIAFTPDGATLASASADRTARLWDVRSRHPSDSPIRYTGKVTDVAFDRKGRILATVVEADLEGSIPPDKFSAAQLLDARSRTPIDIRRIGAAVALAFSPTSPILVVRRVDDKVQIWDTNARTYIGELVADVSGERNGIAFSPDGTTLAITDDNRVQLWDVRSQESIGDLTSSTDVVNDLAFSPDSNTLATVSSDDTLRLWDVRSRKPIGEPLAGHGAYIVAFSPDGTTLATVGSDTLRLWDVRSHSAIGDPLNGHSDEVLAVAFSPDGTMLATASADHTVRLWNLGPRMEPLHAICATTAQLPPDVWAEYAPDEPLPKPCA